MTLVSYRRHRSRPRSIQHGVGLYLRFTLSYRNVEELLVERRLEQAVLHQSGTADNSRSAA